MLDDYSYHSVKQLLGKNETGTSFRSSLQLLSQNSKQTVLLQDDPLADKERLDIDQMLMSMQSLQQITSSKYHELPRYQVKIKSKLTEEAP